MRVRVVVVGKARAPLASAIDEYERRAARYWNFDVVEVREEKAGRGVTARQVREAEARRLVEAVPAGADVVLLTRRGEPWSSRRLAGYLEELALHGHTGAAFIIGGAEGVEPSVLGSSHRRVSLSAMTLPHELARLVLAEQLYRAGTILRGEPYHREVE